MAALKSVDDFNFDSNQVSVCMNGSSLELISLNIYQTKIMLRTLISITLKIQTIYD